VLLFVGAELTTMIAMTVVMIVASHFGHPLPAPNAAAWRAGSMSLPIIIMVSIVNGTFEELMEVGYVFKATEKYGMWAAVIISVLIRTALHIPFGVVAMGSVAVIGGIFALVYLKWRQLWPLIVAHILADLFALVWMAHLAAR
jgi:membrane protease YdiL (CAAX protease family)